MHNYCGGGILTSCTKDQPMVKEEYNTENPKNIEKQIVQFKQTMLDKHKSGEVIELNDAVWMMEAVFNYYHGFTGEDYLTTVTDSTYIPVAYSGFDDVPVEELQQLFVKVNNAIVASFEAYPAQNKKPYMFDLELQATTQGNQLLVMTTVGSVSTQKAAIIGDETPFGETDYWYPSFLDGKCGIYEGMYAGERDASTEWPRKLRIKYNPRAAMHHFIDIETYDIVILPYEYPYQANPYHFPYLLMEGEENCLTSDMMNFYYNGLNYIVKDKMPSGKTFANCYIYMDFIDGIKSIYWRERVNWIQYGVRVENIAEHQLDFPEPL